MSAHSQPHPPVGSRVKAISFASSVTRGDSVDPKTGLIRNAAGEVVGIDDNVTVPPGTQGTVVFSDEFNLKVTWDNGSGIGLIAGEDEWEVLC